MPIRLPPAGIIKQPMGIILPHVLFACLFHNFHDKWVDRICGGRLQNITEFWETQQDNPAFPGHPMHAHVRPYREMAIPFAMHGDGVTVTAVGKKSQKHMDCISFCSVLADRMPTIDSNFLIAFIFHVLNAPGGGTSSTVWQVITWSFYWLFQGQWPDRDWTGRKFDATDGEHYYRKLQPLAGGYYMVCWIIRSDLDYLLKSFGIGGRGEVCHLCRADNGAERPYTDVRPEALWRTTLWNNETHATKFPNRHKLLKHVPGLGITACVPDELHVKHLGVDAAFVGGYIDNLPLPCCNLAKALLIIYPWRPHVTPTLQHGVFFGGVMALLVDTLDADRDLSLKKLWALISAAYKELRTRNRLSTITHGMIKGPSKTFPCISAKALVVRDLLPVMVEVPPRLHG